MGRQARLSQKDLAVGKVIWQILGGYIAGHSCSALALLGYHKVFVLAVPAATIGTVMRMWTDG